jgi:F0F1-type ATP synthase membrane subunit a
MMAGHTLLKVIAGFSWTLVGLGNFFLFVLHLVPVLILIPLFVLESAVAVIQSFVFTVLICIYINDGLNLH